MRCAAGSRKPYAVCRMPVAVTTYRTLNQIVTTTDGSHTIYVPELDEHYHSVHGAFQESEFIFMKNGYDTCNNDPVNILEIGFGTGLNALLTAYRSLAGKRKVFYTTLDKYPLDKEITEKLNHHIFAGPSGKELFDKIHEAEWGKMICISPAFSLLKIRCDLTKDAIGGSYDLVYFDAFGPDKQPEMWSGNILKKISDVIKPNGIFVTYSCKGEVKRNLREYGFKVTLVQGPPGKRHITRAIKI